MSGPLRLAARFPFLAGPDPRYLTLPSGRRLRIDPRLAVNGLPTIAGGTIIFADSLFGSGTLPGAWTGKFTNGGGTAASDSAAQLDGDGYGLDSTTTTGTSDIAAVYETFTRPASNVVSAKYKQNIVSAASVAGGQVGTILFDTTSSNDVAWLQSTATAGNFQLAITKKAGGTTAATLTTQPGIGSTHAIEIIADWSGANPVYTCYLDGSQVAQITDSTSGTTVNLPNRAYLGTFNNSVAFSGHVYYDAFSLADTSQQSGSFTITGPNSAASLPSNHNGNITVSLVGSGTSFANGTTTMTPSGVAGWAVVSTTVTDATHATVVLSCPAVATPPAGATGTLTLTEGGTGAATGTISIATPTLAVSPTSFNTSGSATASFTGTHTLWQGDNPQFTASGVAGTSIGASTETANTASSATLTAGSSTGTETFTDPSTGATVTATISAGPTQVPITDANWFAPPDAWDKSGGAMGTNIIGSSFLLGFTGTSVKVTFGLGSLIAGSVSAGDYPVINYCVDRGPWSSYQLTSADSAVAKTLASGLASGNHTLWCYVSNWANGSFDAWDTPVQWLQVTGATLDAGASTVAPSSPAVPASLMLVCGDSITESVNGNVNDNAYSYAWHLAWALGCYPVFLSRGGTGWRGAGAGNWPAFHVPATPASQSWRWYYLNQSRLTSGKLQSTYKYVYVNHGTNDTGQTDANVTASVSDWIAQMATAAPGATVIVQVPFGSFKRAAIASGQSGTAAKLSDCGTDVQNYFLNTGATAFSDDGLHPNKLGHGLMSAYVARAVQALFGAHRRISE